MEPAMRVTIGYLILPLLMLSACRTATINIQDHLTFEQPSVDPIGMIVARSWKFQDSPAARLGVAMQESKGQKLYCPALLAKPKPPAGDGNQGVRAAGVAELAATIISIGELTDTLTKAIRGLIGFPMSLHTSLLSDESLTCWVYPANAS
jgi:hypothetical protein